MRVGEFEADCKRAQVESVIGRKGLVVPMRFCFLFRSVNVHTGLCYI